MSILVAVDPGIRGCGVARFSSDGKLIIAEYVKNPVGKGDELWAVAAMARAIDVSVGVEFVAERMQVYTAGKGEGDPNNLIALAAVVGAIAARAGCVTWFQPHVWKGNIPKPKPGEKLEDYIVYQRVVERLDPFERSAVQSHGALTHNIYDAIGIGLFHLGRFTKKRVFPR